VTGPRYRLIALHGFLGGPEDWDAVAAECPEARWEPLDVWDLFSSPRVRDWPSIGAALGERLRALAAQDSLPTYVVGYSLGARLAMAVAELGSAQSAVAGTCLVSGHPGLPDADEQARAERKAADETWARRFVDAPVHLIWKQWDSQPVFAGTSVPRRGDRLPAPRATIARTMRVASLSSQPDRRPQLLGWAKPLLWVVGERDVRYRAVAESLSAGGVPATFVTCEHAGHRVPWDNPVLFCRTLREWIEGRR
jgi:2-succinyl-6-hydroxy-2,4-cyclohexadiene-1-carboxylate synthase